MLASVLGTALLLLVGDLPLDFAKQADLIEYLQSDADLRVLFDDLKDACLEARAKLPAYALPLLDAELSKFARSIATQKANLLTDELKLRWTQQLTHDLAGRLRQLAGRRFPTETEWKLQQERWASLAPRLRQHFGKHADVPRDVCDRYVESIAKYVSELRDGPLASHYFTVLPQDKYETLDELCGEFAASLAEFFKERADSELSTEDLKFMSKTINSFRRRVFAICAESATVENVEGEVIAPAEAVVAVRERVDSALENAEEMEERARDEEESRKKAEESTPESRSAEAKKYEHHILERFGPPPHPTPPLPKQILRREDFPKPHEPPVGRASSWKWMLLLNVVIIVAICIWLARRSRHG